MSNDQDDFIYNLNKKYINDNDEFVMELDAGDYEMDELFLDAYIALMRHHELKGTLEQDYGIPIGTIEVTLKYKKDK